MREILFNFHDKPVYLRDGHIRSATGRFYICLQVIWNPRDSLFLKLSMQFYESPWYTLWSKPLSSLHTILSNLYFPKCLTENYNFSKCFVVFIFARNILVLKSIKFKWASFVFLRDMTLISDSKKKLVWIVWHFVDGPKWARLWGF